MAVLSRIANRDHAIAVGPGDTIVLASSLIPGNENAVNRVINGLTRLGATIVHKGNALVHVSGHASAGELLYLYNIVKPRNVMPVHGEWRHLRANAALARATGVPESSVIVAEDGAVVDLRDGAAQVVGAVPVRYVYVDGSGVGDISEESLKDRRVLGEEGFISIFVVINATERRVAVDPQIHARGVVEGEQAFDGVLEKVREVLDAALADGMIDTHQLQQLLRRTVGRWVSHTHRRRPMIIPVVVET